MGNPGHLAPTGNVPDSRCSRPLSPALAHRARLQATEKPDRIEGATGHRRTLRQTLRAGSSPGHPLARTRCRRVRGLSPLARRRLTRPAVWRLLRQLVATLLQAIIPEPTIACLRRAATALQRHLREPPRRRSYQKMARLF